MYACPDRGEPVTLRALIASVLPLWVRCSSCRSLLPSNRFVLRLSIAMTLSVAISLLPMVYSGLIALVVSAGDYDVFESRALLSAIRLAVPLIWFAGRW